ncbi:MAG: hypothetical protein AAFS10_23055 [Myxococcota bacterium]
MVVEFNGLQLQTSPDGTPGDRGFKLVGRSKDERLARVWVRRKRGAGRQVWRRYLAPPQKEASPVWEVCLYEEKGTGAMTRIDFSDDTLKRLAKEYNFPDSPDGVEALQALDIDDPLFDKMRDWAVKQTQAK